MKAYYDSKPLKLEAVGNGSWLYRWGIEEETATSTDGDGNEVTSTQWSCEEVTVWAPLSESRIKQAVITGKWDSGHEMKLLNEYYSAQLGVYGAKTSDEAKAKVQAYKDFLTERAEVRAQVEKDCEELGIN